MSSLTILPTQQLKNIAYLSYVHLLLDYAYQAHIESNGTHILSGDNKEVVDSLMLNLMAYLHSNGWTYDNLAKNANQPLRNYYNMIDPCVEKHFKKGGSYIPSFLALVMLHRVRHWKLDIPNLSTYLQYFVDKLKEDKQDRSKYYLATQEIVKKLKLKAIV